MLDGMKEVVISDKTPTSYAFDLLKGMKKSLNSEGTHQQ